MKLETDPRLPIPGSVDAEQRTYQRLYELFRSMIEQINGKVRTVWRHCIILRTIPQQQENGTKVILSPTKNR